MSDPSPLLNRLKLRHLRLITELETTFNLHRAAERMNLSQPSASKLLQEIEHALHVPLFERRAQGVFPTSAGTLAARYARLILNDLVRLKRDMDALRTGAYGAVSIGSIVAALPDFVTPVLARTAESMPGLHIALTVDTSDTLLASLEAGHVDFVLGRTLNTRRPLSLQCHDLGSEPLAVVVGANNPIVDNGNLTLADIADEQWILQTNPSPMRRAIEAAFALALLPSPTRSIEASSMFATIDLLQHGRMMAVIPKCVCQHYEASGMLRRLSVELPDLLGAFSLITIEERPLSPAAAHVHDAILQRSIEKRNRPFQDSI